MIVEQIWMGNSLRNFNYLIACPETGEALAIDPLDHEKCLAKARHAGFEITQIVNTHEHGDHIGGNGPMVQATSARILAHARAAGVIPNVDRGLQAGDTIRVGKTVELEVLDTPGHTMSHVCLKSHTETPALFCGDTLFNAGAGNCHAGGHPVELYRTFASQLRVLSRDTIIYPGHDYIERNLRFTLDREPDNEVALKLLGQVRDQDPNRAFRTNLELEMQINTFFRLSSPSVILHLRETFPDLSEFPDEEAVFLKLRQLRNKW